MRESLLSGERWAVLQLRKGVRDCLGSSCDVGPVIQHCGRSPVSGARSGREPEDARALPSGSLQSESGEGASSQGPLSLEGEIVRKFPG